MIEAQLFSDTVVKFGNSDLEYEDDSQDDDWVNQSPNKEKVTKGIIRIFFFLFGLSKCRCWPN